MISAKHIGNCLCACVQDFTIPVPVQDNEKKIRQHNFICNINVNATVVKKGRDCGKKSNIPWDEYTVLLYLKTFGT